MNFSNSWVILHYLLMVGKFVLVHTKGNQIGGVSIRVRPQSGDASLQVSALIPANSKDQTIRNACHERLTIFDYPSSQRKNERAPFSECSEEFLKSVYIRKLKEPQDAFPDTIYHCNKCEYHISSITHARNHLEMSTHFDVERQEQRHELISKVPDACESHVKSLSKVLKGALTEYQSQKKKNVKDVTESLIYFLKLTIFPEMGYGDSSVELAVFGSTIYECELEDSDINVALLIPNLGSSQLFEVLNSVLECLKKNNIPAEMSSDESSNSSIVFTYEGIPVRLCHNSAAVYRSQVPISHLLKTYVSLRPEIVKFMQLIRLWATKVGVDSKNKPKLGLPRYGFDIMAIHYLQQIGMIPVFHELYDDADDSSSHIHHDDDEDARTTFSNRTQVEVASETRFRLAMRYETDREKIGSKFYLGKKWDISRLWIGFFKYYVEKHRDGVVQITQIAPMTKDTTKWNRKTFHIVDPFRSDNVEQGAIVDIELYQESQWQYWNEHVRNNKRFEIGHHDVWVVDPELEKHFVQVSVDEKMPNVEPKSEPKPEPKKIEFGEFPASTFNKSNTDVRVKMVKEMCSEEFVFGFEEKNFGNPAFQAFFKWIKMMETKCSSCDGHHYVEDCPTLKVPPIEFCRKRTKDEIRQLDDMIDDSYYQHIISEERLGMLKAEVGKLERYLRDKYESKVKPTIFGSVMDVIGRGSDIDVCLRFDDSDEPPKEYDPVTTTKVPIVQHVNAITTTKVPIVNIFKIRSQSKDIFGQLVFLCIIPFFQYSRTGKRWIFITVFIVTSVKQTEGSQASCISASERAEITRSAVNKYFSFGIKIATGPKNATEICEDKLVDYMEQIIIQFCNSLGIGKVWFEIATTDLLVPEGVNATNFVGHIKQKFELYKDRKITDYLTKNTGSTLQVQPRKANIQTAVFTNDGSVLHSEIEFLHNYVMYLNLAIYQWPHFDNLSIAESIRFKHGDHVVIVKKVERVIILQIIQLE